MGGSGVGGFTSSMQPQVQGHKPQVREAAPGPVLPFTRTSFPSAAVTHLPFEKLKDLLYKTSPNESSQTAVTLLPVTPWDLLLVARAAVAGQDQ